MRKRIFWMLAAGAMVAFLSACQKAAENKVSGNDEPEMSQEDLAIEAYREIIHGYLDYTAEEMNEGMKMAVGIPVIDLSEDSTMVYSVHLAQEANRVLRICDELMEKRDMCALHDSIYNNFQAFITSPMSTLEGEKYLIGMILELVGTAYPDSTAKRLEEARFLFDWRLMHVRAVESFRDGKPVMSKEMAYVHPEHVPTVLGLMDIYGEMGDYAKAIELGTETMLLLAELDDENVLAADLLEKIAQMNELSGNMAEAKKLREMMR